MTFENKVESEKNTVENTPVVITKRLFNFFLFVLLFLMTSVLVLMGMIWKLNERTKEHAEVIQNDWQITKIQGLDIADLQKLTHIQNQAIEAMLDKLEQISKNCCPAANNQTSPTVKPTIGVKPMLQSKKRNGADCIVEGVNVCIPLVAVPAPEKNSEPTTQNETELTTFLPCRCAKILS